jgi:hypothetical protein
VEWLKVKVLSSNPSTTKKRKEKASQANSSARPYLEKNPLQKRTDRVAQEVRTPA